MMADGKYNTQTNNGVEMAGDKQQSSLSSVRERRSRESHCKSSTSTSSSQIRSRGRSQPKRSQSSSALDDKIKPQCRVRFFPTSSSSNSVPTLSTCESSSVSRTSGVVGSLNKDSKYKVCSNVMQRQLNESINVSTNMDINNKSDLGSSELTLLCSNVQGKGVTRSSEKDERGGTTFLPTFGAEDNDTRRSQFEQCKGEEEEEEASDSDCKDEEKNEMDKQAIADYKEKGLKAGKGIMLCMPVTEEPNDKQLTNHDEPTRRLRRYRSREQTTNRSSRSRSLDNERRPDPEGFPCQDYSRQASTRHQRNGKLSVKQPTPQEPEEEKIVHHSQRRPRRPRRSSNTKHTARSSSFTYGGNGHQVPPPPPPLKSEQHATTSLPKRHNSASDFQQLLESVATHKSKVGNNCVNMTVNPRQDDGTVSTKASSIIPQGQIKDGQILRDPHLQDVKELPQYVSGSALSPSLPSMTKTDDTVISSYPSLCEQPSIKVNLNNYDKRGFCVVHPHVRLRKKKFFKRLSLSLQLNCMDPNGIGVVWNSPDSSSDEYNDPEEEDGWKILTSVCPECCTDELRRTQLALAAIQRQQQMCQSVEMNSVTEHQQATASLDRVSTLDMLSRLPTRKLMTNRNKTILLVLPSSSFKSLPFSKTRASLSVSSRSKIVSR